MTSLLAATVFPAQSEALLLGMHLTGVHSSVVLVAVATLGNVLGACINWLLGRYIEHFKKRRWFPVREQALDKAVRMYRRYGVWTLLLSWVPVIGDPLTVIAGGATHPIPAIPAACYHRQAGAICGSRSDILTSEHIMIVVLKLSIDDPGSLPEGIDYRK